MNRVIEENVWDIDTPMLSLADAVVQQLKVRVGRSSTTLQQEDVYASLAEAIKVRMLDAKHTDEAMREKRQINYLSLEFLMGRMLGNAVLNLDLQDEVRDALSSLACEFEEVEGLERDAGLGNGGLGRLAACFLDSCASLAIPVTGYGLRYRYGMFAQQISLEGQIEKPDDWLVAGNPWEICRIHDRRQVRFGGRTLPADESDVRSRRDWVDAEIVFAVPYDIPVPGYRNGVVNWLRLWQAEAVEELELQAFNAGQYDKAVASREHAEQITQVLYPNDDTDQGKRLRLRQQYFLASASLQDVVSRWVQEHGEDFSNFAQGNGFQLNDTHPVVAIPELMRLLVDEYGLDWQQAWGITSECMFYTNHTLLPEALEQWSVALFQSLLPRIMEIIYEINAVFLAQVREAFPGDEERVARMSIIGEGHERTVRMAHLGIVGSCSINGVAALHTELLKDGLFRDFHEMWPQRINNKTNGVTPRRWLEYCNPALSKLVTSRIGSDWKTDLSGLARLADFADDQEFQQDFARVKYSNKVRLAALLERECGVKFNPELMFDVQVKRIHEYKRQLLNVLHVIHRYERILAGDGERFQGRCVLFGGKAAPGYAMAKLIIRLINNVARVVNAEKRCEGLLHVAFLPDYRVSAMECICPGTDLSEQISTAGKEASGTGNMKFMMNGALTIGTLDGANIEIREAVGAENFFLFGMTAAEVQEMRASYDPLSLIAADRDLQAVMTLIESGHFDLDAAGLFKPLLDGLRSPHDPWLTVGDFRSYIDAQIQVDALYANTSEWTSKAILNTSHSGYFSSDRTIAQYRDEIWFPEGS